MGMSKVKKTESHKKDVLPSLHDEDFCFTKGVEAFQGLKFDTALKWLKKAVHLNREEPVYQCQLAIVYTELSYYHKANEILREVAKKYGKRYPDCYYLLANNFAQLGLLQEAKKYCYLYMKLQPQGEFYDDTSALLDLIETTEDEESDYVSSEDHLLEFQEEVFFLLQHNEYKKALPLLEEMIELFPEHTLAKHDYSEALFFTGQKREAIEREKSLLSESKSTLPSIINLAIFYHELGDEKQASNYTDQLKNLYPLQGDQRLKIANTLSRTGYHTAAFNRFITLQSIFKKTHPAYYRWWSYTNYVLGDCQRAEEIWQEGIKRFPRLQEDNKPWEFEHNNRRND